MIVAIDGPAGAGKTSVAVAVASQLGFLHMDTGAMYRTIAVAVLDRHLDIDDPRAVAAAVASVRMELGNGLISLDGDDVTSRVRDPDVTRTVSLVAAHPAVRSALVPLQRQLATGRDVVVEGRDIATVVFPDAEVKIFLTASPRERVARRGTQIGVAADPQRLAALERDMLARDERDSTRSVSPLQRAESAELIDSTEMELDEVVDRVVAIVNERRRT
ncbi:MAG TPA: (d)CMP kinase [Actinomycetota bacterium]|nr:(d)CMP kinase [Actinomycetota bacterium]